MKPLSDYISIQRRYSRSVNLERDLNIAESVIGYIPTQRALETFERFISAYSTPNSVRAWTLTGVYGTGKSSFAHFLSSVLAPREEPVRKNTMRICEKAITPVIPHCREFLDGLPSRGLVRAVGMAHPEPVAHTIIRILRCGTKLFWEGKKSQDRKPKVLTELDLLLKKISKNERIENQKVLNILCDVASYSGSGVLLIIDELGKNLEYSSLYPDDDNLFLLQQIAELPSHKDQPKIFLFGLLHQAFHDYAHGLTMARRTEWGKIQGRFEDVPFAESQEQTLRLIGHAIDQSKAKPIIQPIKGWANKWVKAFSKSENVAFKRLSKENIASLYPLNPVSALTLPLLSARYAQNDRSVFTFLASAEPHSFLSFLEQNSLHSDKLPTIKLHKIYDYFVESAGLLISSRPNSQRWIEIQGRISDANHLETEAIILLKTIGILNLIGNTGAFLRATKELVILSMCDNPEDSSEEKKWEKRISFLIKKGFVIWRKRLNELRIWEGSDFNIEEEISNQVEIEKSPTAHLLTQYSFLRPLVAQRHSYRSGTLRYFERKFLDNPDILKSIKCSNNDSDGLIVYWTGDKKKTGKPPEKTADRKPLIIISPHQTGALTSACLEYSALRKIDEKSAQLDGIARREIRQRLVHSKNILDQYLSRTFNVADKKVTCWVAGNRKNFRDERAFFFILSELCDSTYHKGLTLWNELINRRILTTQGAKARGVLIKAMFQSISMERLGLEGYGPECSIYNSLFKETGIHKQVDDSWEFSAPNRKSGLYHVWEAIEKFCLSGTNSPKPLSILYEQLYNPPYGVKRGVIPLLLAAVLIKHQDDVGIYYDGTFVPILGEEHFELIEKNLDRFSVKHFQIAGLREQIFKELESIIIKSGKKEPKKYRNAKLLEIVRPLIRFVKTLPKFVLNTKKLSNEAIALREALLHSREPDNLIFDELPKACGLDPISPECEQDVEKARILKTQLIKTMKELQMAYDNLLSRCRDLLYEAFSVRSEKEKLREDLRVRAHYLSDKCIEPRLKSFLFASMDETADDRQWLESLIMVIAEKPADSWKDENMIGFEMQLSDFARRFINLESLQNNLARFPEEGVSAQKVTITRSDGHEIHRTIWSKKGDKEKVEIIVKDILEKDIIKNNEPLQNAIIAGLIEKVLAPKSEEKFLKNRKASKWQKRKSATS